MYWSRPWKKAIRTSQGTFSRSQICDPDDNCVPFESYCRRGAVRCTPPSRKHEHAACVCVRAHAWMPGRMPFLGIDACMHVCLSVCMCVCIYICTHTLHDMMTWHYITLHYIILHCIHYINALHCITLHYITVHYITYIHYINELHCIALHYISVCVCVSVCLYVCMHVCTCTCIYVRVDRNMDELIWRHTSDVQNVKQRIALITCRAPNAQRPKSYSKV